MINFGGDVVVRNLRGDGQPWRVGIEASETCTQAGTLTTLAMLQGRQCEDFLRASGAKYWIQLCND